MRCGEERWSALTSIWKKDIKFDPAKDGVLAAAERLAKGEGNWGKVWQRFAETPAAFPGLPELLRRVEPAQMGLAVGAQDLSRWPSHNAACEDQVLTALQGLAGKSHAEACRCVRQLEGQHGKRRSWIWAQLGLSPMALVLAPLGRLAQRADQPLVGSTPQEFVEPYTTDGWEADLSAWQAMAMAQTAQEEVVRKAVAALLRPWLDDTASRFQKAVASSGLPTPAEQGAITAEPGEVLLFADGLRYDVARQLQLELEVMGITGSLSTRWAALPTVTATAKPTIAAELPKHLTASKWARCAAIKGESQVPVPTAAWSWIPSIQFATPNGAACFNTGGSYAYAHGGISLQECLTPVLVVSGGANNAPAAAITEISWKGLRCNLEVSGATGGLKADLRRDSISGPAVANKPKPIDEGCARLLVEDDDLEGAVVMAVLISPDGRVVAQRRTVVGGEA